MYGLLLQAIADSIRTNYGENTWRSVRQKANIELNEFDIRTKYSDNDILNMLKQLSEVTGDSIDVLTRNFGHQFVSYMPKYGYDRILRILGRHMRDFLRGLDNLHEYMRHTYPHMIAPSFIVSEETTDGLVLHYRSIRNGFAYYVKGQIEKIAKVIYGLQMSIEILSQSTNNDINHTVYRLKFNNTAFTNSLSQVSVTSQSFKILSTKNIKGETLFSIFPFHIIFNNDLSISSFGESLKLIFDNIKKKYLTDYFELTRPPVELTWNNIIEYKDNLFELKSKILFGESYESLILRGQMFYIQQCQKIAFLATPLVSALDKLTIFGFYVNDLSLYDYSRDLLIIGTQQQADLRLALDKQRTKSKDLEDSMKKLDEEMRKADELIKRILPKKVADSLINGTPLMNLCESFTQCTILFSDIVDFTSTCSHLTPIEVINLLNEMFTRFDSCLEKFNCYKVETIGDAYMIVSGVPERTNDHALEIINMGFSMLEEIDQMINPITKENMQIRIGCHSGPVVAGIVGLKMPRYCLFGDTVQIANKMEATSQLMRVHITEKTKCLLEPSMFEFKERGKLELSSGEILRTFIINGRNVDGKVLFPFNHVSTDAFDAKDHGAKWEGFRLI